MHENRRRLLAALGMSVVMTAGTVDADLAAAQPTTAPVTSDATSQQPLIHAASYLTYEVEARAAAGFGGVSLGRGTVDLYWKTSLPASMRSVVAHARTIAPIRVYLTTYSLSERKAAAAAVTRAAAADASSGIHSILVPVGTDDVLVQTEGDIASAQQLARDVSSIPVRSATADRPNFAHRRNDIAPFSGGNRISNGTGECTAGWSVTDGARRVTYGAIIAILTAGHCGQPQQQWVTPENRTFIGNNGGENIAHDIMTINTAWAANRIYDGGGANSPATQFFKSVVGWDRTFPGELLCTSGSTTGASCNLQNSATFDFSYVNGTETYTDLVLATRLNGGIGSQAGDSGGPVFALAGDSPRIPNIGQGLAQQGQVTAKGTISGRRNTSEVIYQDFHTSYRDFSAVPVTALNIINLRSRRCIDADLNTIGANPNRAQLWDCNNQPQQQLTWNTFDDRTIRNARNSKCLDADLNTIGANGTVVQWWDCQRPSAATMVLDHQR